MGEEPPKPASTPTGAVFLSYASQDTEAAQRICDALRAAGLEVWFDKRELRGGDVWDRQIREQIHDCRLFVPVISANTEARDEGYFRREWGLATDRTRDMAEKRTFLIPVVIDDTSERGASVPDKFRQIQWTRLPGGATAPTFVARIAALVGAPAPVAAVAGPGPAPVRPPRVRTRNRRVVWIPLGLAALALVLVGAWFALQHSSLRRNAQADAAGQSQPAITDKSIAVLPFADLSEKHDQEYFADGMAEEVIDLLTNIPGLRVISRTSSFQFKGKNPDLRAVGNTLGVSYLVEGSVRKSGDRLRVTAQLISAQDGSHFWSNTYDEPVGDAISLQEKIASNLGRALQVSVGATGSPRRAFNSPEAYDFYLRGLHAIDRRDKEGFEAAAAYFQQVLELDPTSVPAAESLAWTYWLTAAYGHAETAEGYERARLWAKRALGLDPRSGVAYSVLSSVHFAYDWDWAAAERDGKEALRLEPRNPTVMINLANVYRAPGRWDESARLLESANSLDPLNPSCHLILSWVRYSTGELREAEAEARKVLKINPMHQGAQVSLGLVLLAEGKLEDALAQMQQQQSNRGLALAYYAIGRRAESDAALAKLMNEDEPYRVAYVYAYRHELDQAFTWLERAYREKDTGLVNLKANQVDPLLKNSNFTQDPRYKAFLRKMNLPE